MSRRGFGSPPSAPVANMPPMSVDAADLLLVAAARVAEPAGREWLAVAGAEVASAGITATAIGVKIAAARRCLGDAPIDFTETERRLLSDAGMDGARAWSLERCARAALILKGVASSGAQEPQRIVDELYRTGDTLERCALLGCLALMPEPARFVETAVESCRTHVVDVFESIACENVYPAMFFGDSAFNQMVLKAIFLEVAVDRISGLDRRANEDLARMVAGYASERTSAGRAVPADVDRVIALVAETRASAQTKRHENRRDVG